MSYREENGQVILTISRDDYNSILFALGAMAGNATKHGSDLSWHLQLMNRINEGNPNYTPYQVEEKP
jgi:hypothetical protein